MIMGLDVFHFIRPLCILIPTELVHFSICRGERVRTANTTISPTKSVKYLGVHQDKHLTFEALVQSVLGKIAKHVSVVMRLRLL